MVLGECRPKYFDIQMVRGESCSIYLVERSSSSNSTIYSIVRGWGWGGDAITFLEFAHMLYATPRQRWCVNFRCFYVIMVRCWCVHVYTWVRCWCVICRWGWDLVSLSVVSGDLLLGLNVFLLAMCLKNSALFVSSLWGLVHQPGRIVICVLGSQASFAPRHIFSESSYHTVQTRMHGQEVQT